MTVPIPPAPPFLTWVHSPLSNCHPHPLHSSFCVSQEKLTFGPRNSYTVEGLKPNTEYSFSLAAISTKGIGAFTNELVQRTSQASMSQTWLMALIPFRAFGHAVMLYLAQLGALSQAPDPLRCFHHPCIGPSVSSISSPPLIHPDCAFPPAFSLWFSHTASAS